MTFNSFGLTLLFILMTQMCFAQQYGLTSPDKKISIAIQNAGELSYTVSFNGKPVMLKSVIGFEFKSEPSMTGGFAVTDSREEAINENWNPVVRSKHATVVNNCNELKLTLKEKEGPMRQMVVSFRAYNDGIAFRTRLFRSAKNGHRELTKELTTFSIPGNPRAWVVEYGKYASSQESEFFERSLSYINDSTIAGMPFLMDYGDKCWVAITEAAMDNYPAFYIGTSGRQNVLTTKLAPLPGEPEKGVKARFDDEVDTPWRVVMIGETPGSLIESEIIQNLNPPCAIADPSWIKPGMCAWDHWWSGEVKMEMPVIKKYIDMASVMGWPYMLVDWQWYGKFNDPAADITKWAPQIDMPEIISYARSKNVKIFLWLYNSDVNRNSSYKKAFPLYKDWGIAGVKIDFMDRDDQDMVNWYREIIRCAADNQLLVDFHGAYKPDGIIRTYPNMITREGVMGNEYYKFSDKMSPGHNVKLAFTRMLAGQMDYTPGGFLNVTSEQFKRQSPTMVWNTRAAELSKFVVYESPLTVVCDSPDNILNKPGADFLKRVPTTWDDIRFMGGYPGDYVAIAKRSGDYWFVGILNNSKEKEVVLETNFLTPGEHLMESWSDAGDASRHPQNIKTSMQKINSDENIKIRLAGNGGWVAIIKP